MRIIHLYPFLPGGRHGGTLRLRAALAGTARAGEPELHFFDPVQGAWRGPAEDIEAMRAAALPAPAPPGLKRRLFPSTLWESGRRARRAIAGHLDRLALDGESTVFLHTSYLAPLLAVLPVARRALVDAYDLVWLAHANDARSTTMPAGPVRAVYSATVRLRELRALAGADTVLAAGYEDFQALRTAHRDARWVPTPTPVEPVEPRTGVRELRVGLLGNFAHQSTRASAALLLGSSLAADPRVTIVLAGLHSEALADRRRVEVRGPVERPEDLYAEVDCIVAPVGGGSGMKVKLAEAVLAGRPVVTTPLGAAGYPPSVSRFFSVRPAASIDVGVVRAAIAAFDTPAARAALEPELGWQPVLERYAAAVR
jgi:hypothetical protein